MDSSTKPVKKNPRKGAFCLSQLLFGWLLPLFYRGSRRGLGKDDLTKCLKADRSEDLGDELEEQWEKEVSQARIASREPKLRNALFRTFYKQSLFDGFLIFLFVLIKTILPVVLAQLLVQFQEPTNSTHVAVVNINNDVFSTVPPMAMPLMMLPDTTQSHLENLVFDETAMINKRRRKRRIRIEDDKPAPGNSIGGSKPNVAQEAEGMETTIFPDLSEQFGADDPSTTANSTVVDDLSDFLHHAWNDAFWLSGLLVLLTLLGCFCCHHSDLRERLVGARMRIACCSLIYRKTLRMSRKAAGQTPAGYMINLLSNDVSRLDYGFIYVHYVWVLPFQACFTCYLIWRRVQWAAIVGVVGLLVKTIPVQTGLSRLSSIIRMRVAKKTDQRVGIMNELIQGIQVIKMYAWERPFAKLIRHARQMELKIVRKSAYVRGLYMTFLLFTTRTALFCTMMAMALLGDELTAARVFVVATYFHILANTMSAMFVRGIAEIAEAMVAMRRLERFLEFEERETEALPDGKSRLLAEFGLNGDATEKQRLIESETQLPPTIAVSLKGVTARWGAVRRQEDFPRKAGAKQANGKLQQDGQGAPDELPPVTLSNLNIDFRKGLLIGVIGPVGSGKSSLLQAILRELPLESGSVVAQGRFAYVSQEPWVFSGTVRQNILFGQPMEKERYEAVVRACALVTDFEQLPDGDRTMIGERGAALSGGQKARISLARAVYRRADVYLLDDPLSAVDAHVGRHLFDLCLGPQGRLGTLRATRILVTHQVHFLKEADWVVVLNEGRVQAQGTPHDLVQSGIDFVELVERKEVEGSELEGGGGGDGDGSVGGGDRRSRRDSRASARSGGSSVHADVSDEEERDLAADAPVQSNMEGTSRGKVQGSLLLSYLGSGANGLIMCGLLALFLATQLAASGADYWVAFWTSQEEQRLFRAAHNLSAGPEAATDELPPLLSTETCMAIHGALVGSIFLIAITRSISFYQTSVRASQNLHDAMFAGCVSTTMRFYDTNPSGRILNRFSKDMGSVDELLPKAMLDASQIILSLCGTLVVTVLVNPLFLVPLALLGVVFWFVRRIYLKTSKNIKRLEGITRSPVFSHLSASLAGLPTIRAFGAQGELIREFDAHQDIHTASFYMFITASTAFGFALDLLCLIFVFIVVFSFLLVEQDTFGDRVGLAITQAMALTGMMQWGIRQSAEVANFMMSVERLLEYRDLAPERQPERPRALNAGWPAEGRIEFRSVTYRYFEGAQAVLRDLSFEIRPREKVGIVGRTGAGKSSLIGALFRLAQVEGEIRLDGIDTADITLEQLRSKVSIIPQDPVLFSGTLRRNLDPFEDYPDAELWGALEQVELKELANTPAGLQMAVAAGGSNFSVGQRQLICLARAILRNNRILVLDEATANVDPNTDRLIQETIRHKFADCTVLTIAHRLNTIMDSDRVLVMDAGQAVELGTPHELLQLPISIFRDMVLATGPAESERLQQIALHKHEQQQLAASD